MIKASGIGVFDAFLERTLPEIRKSHQQVIFWEFGSRAMAKVLNEHTFSRRAAQLSRILLAREQVSQRP